MTTVNKFNTKEAETIDELIIILQNIKRDNNNDVWLFNNVRVESHDTRLTDGSHVTEILLKG